MCLWFIYRHFYQRLYNRDSQTAGRAPRGGAVGTLGGELFVRGTFILNETLAQNKI